jgi:prepilin-type N-terminal cleavage/methylation domain-containing protein
VDSLQRNKWSYGGFSLMELMVVIAIIGALAAIGMPALLSNRPAKQARSAVNDYYNALQSAKMYAIRSGDNCDVNVKPTNLRSSVMPALPVPQPARALPANRSLVTRYGFIARVLQVLQRHRLRHLQSRLMLLGRQIQSIW